MRSVVGQTNHVVVIGAGLAGLAAALHLRGAGREVTVLERADHPGGRVGRYRFDDYDIDSGATVLTMPELIDEALAAVGRTRDDVSLRIHRLAPAYHARFADGSDIRVFDDADTMAAEVDRACGPAEARGYRRLRDWLDRIYAAEFDDFMDANFDSPLDMVRTRRSRTALTALARLGGFGRLGPRVRSYVGDERLTRLFTFQALYAGMAPDRALALYGAIPNMDTCQGVYFPEGGMRAITTALAEAFTAAGGQLVLGAEVDRIVYSRGVQRTPDRTDANPSREADARVRGRRAEAVRTTDGRDFPCDAVVLTADLGSLPRFGLRARRGLRASPSAVVAHGTIPAAIAARWPVQAHHTIDFGAAWAQTFAEIAARPGRGRLMSDPSLLLTRPALTDPGQFVDRAQGRFEPFSVLAPCPNLTAAPLDWDRLGPAYLNELLTVLEQRGYTGITEHFTVDHLDTPATWAAQGMIAGTPFSVAHLFRQTGPFRSRNLPRGMDNVVLAGCGTTPGVGVPTTLLSGKLAAARITGDRTRSRTDHRVSVPT
ncbi:phytoene dehydrogenase [Nocardia mangyaensis]|uniref:Phytoene dehydrogenase n=1 Tax=Nocardia mangyaensis TaxID=2213200 RepID=A0A1J0VQ37_9NOCA|nr:phytoene desaturase family protein [Nocardia mangyaensis]APE34079.1 phytoene dehydrogenase [Nocardia mangyaensis]